jgi:hypothetical protein
MAAESMLSGAGPPALEVPSIGAQDGYVRREDGSDCPGSVQLCYRLLTCRLEKEWLTCKKARANFT